MSRRTSVTSTGNGESGVDRVSPKARMLYDESIEVPDGQELTSPPGTSGGGGGGLEHQSSVSSDHARASTSNHRALIAVGRVNSDDSAAAVGGTPGPPKALHSSSSEEEDDDSEEEHRLDTVEGSYDPAEFEHLAVSAEVKELFGFITRYTPQAVELEFSLRPFVPDFIPAVGDIDAFIKVPRPDSVEDGCGLNFLDEPSGKQSDPAVLDLQLRALSKQSSAKLAVVKRVEHAERHSRAVDKWIRDISDLHRSRPPPAVHYTRPMPDIDSLMQEWPPAVEQQLRDIGVPSPDLDSSLASYVDIICGLFDIPVYESRVQALHILFSLHAAVRNSRYNPANIAEENNSPMQ